MSILYYYVVNIKTIVERYYDYTQTIAVVLFEVSLENKGATL